VDAYRDIHHNHGAEEIKQKFPKFIKTKPMISGQSRLTCAVSDFITSFAALDLADSSAATAIASCTFLADF